MTTTFYAWGAQVSEATIGFAPSFKFTGKERDSESGLDNFGARYDSSQYGRFMTPDWSATPMGVPYAKFDDPQSLNLYAYVRNNPLRFMDADGHNKCAPGGCPPPPGTDPAQNQSIDKKQMAKGGAEFTAGAAVVVGILQPEVGVGEVIGGALLSSGLLAKGATDMGVGANGGGDTSEMKDNMDVAQSPTKVVIAVANHWNTKQANNVGDVVEGASAAKNLASNPHQSAVSIGMMGQAIYDGAHAAVSLAGGGMTAYRNVTTPPSSPRPPSPPDF